MSASRTRLHGEAAASGGLAAAICLAISQLIGLIVSSPTIGANLLYGLALSSIAFGGTYAGVFFVSLARHRTVGTRSSDPAPTPPPAGAQPANG